MANMQTAYGVPIVKVLLEDSRVHGCHGGVLPNVYRLVLRYFLTARGAKIATSRIAQPIVTPIGY
jgi:hypothetical protein